VSLLDAYDPRVGGPGYRRMRRQQGFVWHLTCGVDVGLAYHGELLEWSRVSDVLGNLARLELKRREALES
jgi:hypothetical protein